jgi:hypothetical protein
VLWRDNRADLEAIDRLERMMPEIVRGDHWHNDEPGG